MHVVWNFFVLCFLKFLGFAYACPSNHWVQCAVNDNQNCVIPSSINSTTIAYGADDAKIWTFLQVKNAGRPASDFSIACNDATFGDISSSSKICCYNPFGNTISVDGEFDDENNWVLSGNAQDPQFNVPYEKGYARWVRYGANGQFIYRLFSYQVECTSTLFGTLNNNNDDNLCWYFNNIYDENANYISCGSSTDGICNLMVDTDDTQTIRLVKYGAYNTSSFAYHDQFYYRFLYSDNGSTPCNDDLFGAVGADTPNQCFVESVTFSNFFVNPTGYWVQVM